jgi:hypothetical protein
VSAPGPRAKFYIGHRCTRWDVYPQQEPAQVVAHDWEGFYALTEDGRWFKSPASYTFMNEISRADAESAEFRAANDLCTAFSRPAGRTALARGES